VATYVIDSNVAVKWSAMEDHWQQARLLLEDDGQDLIAPVTLLPEALNALVNKYRKREILAATVPAAMATLESSVLLHPLVPLMQPALALSLRYTVSLHDAVFLALALREGCPLVTDDGRLLNAVQRHFPDTLIPLATLPGL
jgi:predicted nucleic acid-binding protein